MRSKDKIRQLERIQRRARFTQHFAGPYHSWLLDRYGPIEMRGRLSLMLGVLTFLVALIVGLNLDLGALHVVLLSLFSSLVGMFLGSWLCPWKSFNQFLVQPFSYLPQGVEGLNIVAYVLRVEIPVVVRAASVEEWASVEIMKAKREGNQP